MGQCLTSEQQEILDGDSQLVRIPQKFTQGIEAIKNPTKSEFKQMVNLLNQAFFRKEQNLSEISWEFFFSTCKSESEKKDLFQYYSQILITFTTLFGIIYVIREKNDNDNNIKKSKENESNKIIGLALMFPPGLIKNGQLFTQYRIYQTKLKLFCQYPFNCKNRCEYQQKAKIKAYISLLEQKHAQHASDDHWYLYKVAILPKYQNKGYGSKFMQLFKQLADADNVQGYLETVGKKNRSFFEKFGFKIYEKVIFSLEKKIEYGALGNDGGTSIMIYEPWQDAVPTKQNGVIHEYDIVRP